MESIVPVAYAAVDRKALETTLNPIYANIINPLIIAAFAFAVLVFVYGVIQMIINQTDTEAHTQGRWSMLGGLIGLFIMLSAWGIVNLVLNTVTTFK